MKRINLLPPEQRVKASRERGRLYVIVGLLVLLVLLGAIYFQQMSVANGKQDDLDQLTAETQAVTQQVNALRPYADIHDLRSEMTETGRALYDARVPWSTVLEEVSLVIPENVRLTSMSCAVPETMLPGETQSSTKNPEPTVDVTFAGTTYSHKDVAEFMTRLGLIPQLTNIELSNSANASDESSTGTTVTFTVTASLRAYVTAPPTTKFETAGGAQ